MTHLASRRAFLTGRRDAPAAPRPPGALPEPAFRRACTRCGDCVAACPEAVLSVDAEGRPGFEPALGACTFCGRCAEACPGEALSAAPAPYPWIAEAAAGCLSLNGVACRACEDRCDARAIRFRPLLGGRAAPLIDAAACTGCGACVAPCPADAIALSPRSPRPVQEETRA